MTEFTRTTTTTFKVHCPGCDGDRIVKVGVRNGQQRYRCKGCRKDFRFGDKPEGYRMDAEMIGSDIRDYFTSKSYKQIAEGLKEEYDLPKEPSKATIYEWVTTYTGKAKQMMKEHKAKTSGHWVAYEMAMDVGGNKMWMWSVMDSKTRYILASHLIPNHDAQAARVVMRKAALAADKPPKTITTDKWRSYINPIKALFPEAKHIQSEGIRAKINNNLAERVQGTVRDRTKTLRGLETWETGQRYIDGWVLTYNHFRRHETLGNKTPAGKAKVNPPFKEWADVVKAGAAFRPRSKTETRPISRQKPKLPQPAEAQGRKGRKRSAVMKPRPVYPKVGTPRKRKSPLPPPWALHRPRLPGLN